MRIGKKPRKKNRPHGAALILLAVVLGITLWAESMMRPVIESIVAHQARVFAVKLINEAMLAQMEQEDALYDKLVTITRGEGGEVVSIEADMAQINRLKSRMSDSVVEKLERGGNSEIAIPLGTLFGSQLTSARGPDITVRVIPVGYVQSEIYNRFSSAGINQTLHQIMLEFTVSMAAVLPGYSVQTETVTNFCVAETVIVGQIPQGYAAIGRDAATFAPVAAPRSQ